MKDKTIANSIGLSQISDEELEIMTNGNSFRSMNNIRKVDDLLALQRVKHFLGKNRRGRKTNKERAIQTAFESILFDDIEDEKPKFPKGTYTINDRVFTEVELRQEAHVYGFDKKAVDKIINKNTRWNITRKGNHLTKH